jgi:capsular polysaccharide transport system permease protein
MRPPSVWPTSRLGRYTWIVLAPTLLTLLYLAVFAADGYVSRAQVMVERETSVVAAGAELAQGLLNVGGGKSKQDALLVESFMRSRTMLEYLDQELDLRGHFSRPKADVIGRLAKDASSEAFLEYYRNRLKVRIDDQSLIISIEFTAFDAAFAHDVAAALIARSEVFVNEVAREFAREQLRFVQDQVEQANERLKAASRQVIALQRSNEVLSPAWEMESIAKIIASLEAELTEQRTQFKTMSAYLNTQAPDMVAARSRISAIEAQLEQERRRLVGSQRPGLNDLMLAYQDAETDLKLATEVYKAALATLEATRLDSVRKVKLLVSVDRPSLAGSAEHPRIWYWMATIFVLLNLAYFVLGLIVATVEDHRE